MRFIFKNPSSAFMLANTHQVLNEALKRVLGVRLVSAIAPLWRCSSPPGTHTVHALLNRLFVAPRVSDFVSLVQCCSRSPARCALFTTVHGDCTLYYLLCSRSCSLSNIPQPLISLFSHYIKFILVCKNSCIVNLSQFNVFFTL